MLKRLVLGLWLYGRIMAELSAQTYPFARLTGNPIDTAGWFFAGDARLGDSPGDVDSDPDEVILCPPSNFRSGAVFFKTPINIASCQKWTAEFDFRMFDGTGADGIAFFFLNNPPQSYINGGGMGIPPRPLGLLVGLDSYQNCNAANTGTVPKLQIRYGDGINNYSECPNPPQPTLSGFDDLRSSVYQRLKIDYDAGNIAVFVNDTLRLSGFYSINFAGYFGLSASTGGSTDLHSIKNFSLYTQKPIFQAPNAGANRTICRNGVTMLGDAGQSSNYIYKWYPTIGLSDSTASNPTLQLDNPGATAATVKYFVSKDTLGGEPRCAFADDVEITVLPTLIQGQKQYTICSNTPTALAIQGLAGVSYQWSPPQFFNNPTVANPSFYSVNADTADTWINAQLSASHPAGCTQTDTIRILRVGRFALAGPDLNLCGSDTIRVGSTPRSGHNYSWFRLTPNMPTLLSYIEDNQAAQTRIAITAGDTLPLTIRFRLLVFRSDLNCRNDDTVAIQVFPKLTPVALTPVQVCAGDSIRLGNTGRTGMIYAWEQTAGLQQTNNAQVWLRGLSLNQSIDTTYYRIKSWEALPTCFSTDSVRIRFKQRPSFQPMADVALCPGDSILLGGGRTFPSTYQHDWQPTTFLAQPDSAASWFFASDLSDSTFSYTQTHTVEGCEASDTVQVRIQKRPGFSGLSEYKACSGLPVLLGGLAAPQIAYVWQPATGLSSDTIANPVFSLSYANSSASQRLTYFLTSTDKATTCHRRDTISVLLQAAPQVSMSRSLNMCSGDTVTIGPLPTDSLIYSWTNHLGLMDTTISRPRFTAQTLESKTEKLILTVISSQTSCLSQDSVWVQIHPLPILPGLNGPSFICGLDSIRTYRFNQAVKPSWNVSWLVKNGEILTSAPSGASVRWLNLVGATIQARVVDSLGCSSLGDTLRVSGVSLPAGILSGPDFLCSGRFEQIPFALVGASGSDWVVSGANHYVQPSPNQIQVDFDSLAGSTFKIQAIPISSEGCRGDTLTKILDVDRFLPVIEAVSVQNPGEVLLSYSGLQNRSGLRLFYGEGLENIQPESAIEQAVLSSLNTQKLLRFQLAGTDRCQIERRSNIHGIMVGKAKADVEAAHVNIQTKWTPYEAAQLPLYELFIESPSPVRRLAEISDTNFFVGPYESAERPTFRVRATWTKGGKQWESWSDTFSPDFQMPALFIPNLITPNGDGRNDTFEIPYLYFFSRARLEIVDRWGKKVYSTDAYQNDWDAATVQGGVYFFRLDLDGKWLNGWIRVEK